MQNYRTLLKNIVFDGTDREDRTGVGVKSIFGSRLQFNLLHGFPIVTTKEVFFKGVVGELLWFLTGSTNIKYLTDNNIHIWDNWATENGDVGPMYGAQWRNWNGYYDQLTNVIEQIKTNNTSRRLVVTAWDPVHTPLPKLTPQENARIGKMSLAPCHCLFQFYVEHEKYLYCQVYQRSVDAFLGLPFNIASYALLTHIIATECSLVAKRLIHIGGDVHLYQNHITEDIVYKQIGRTPYPLPTLQYAVKPLHEYKIDDFKLINYTHHPKIKAEIAV